LISHPSDPKEEVFYLGLPYFTNREKRKTEGHYLRLDFFKFLGSVKGFCGK